MGASIYGNVGGVARKAKELYGNVGGVTRKLKSVYANVNGVVRKIFSGAAWDYEAHAIDGWLVSEEPYDVYVSDRYSLVVWTKKSDSHTYVKGQATFTFHEPLTLLKNSTIQILVEEIKDDGFSNTSNFDVTLTLDENKIYDEFPAPPKIVTWTANQGMTISKIVCTVANHRWEDIGHEDLLRITVNPIGMKSFVLNNSRTFDQ